MSAATLQIEAQLRPWLSAGHLLRQGRVGLEKESLRVAENGSIALSPHPQALGSPLTHPHITTDYSEALLELVTQPLAEFDAVLQQLHDLHLYVIHHLEKESLWNNSMPCILAGEDHIPIARYGSSNLGRMKYIYRVGLGYRYGKVMQVIAGIHFNFSFSADFWSYYQQIKANPAPAREFIDQHYMGMARNLQRFGWIIPYLFGASPAVCKSFFTDREPDLLLFDDSTYYEPYATSLRMSDIGYQNRKEQSMGIKANYNSLKAYISTLARATQQPCPYWQQIGVKVNGEYRQLNANQLQIENEYYSSIRPKQLTRVLETPSRALWERGIAYMELRSLDINPYLPLGIDLQQLHFLHLFMLYCLLRPSQIIDEQERKEIDRNLLWVANQGRDPQLKLQRGGKAVLFSDWAEELLRAMQPLAELLGADYQQALQAQMDKLDCPDLTPSGQILAEMKANKESFYDMAHRLSQKQMNDFQQQSLEKSVQARLDALSQDSWQKQQALEQQKKEDFDQFLANYFAGQVQIERIQN